MSLDTDNRVAAIAKVQLKRPMIPLKTIKRVIILFSVTLVPQVHFYRNVGGTAGRQRDQLPTQE